MGNKSVYQIQYAAILAVFRALRDPSKNVLGTVQEIICYDKRIEEEATEMFSQDTGWLAVEQTHVSQAEKDVGAQLGAKNVEIKAQVRDLVALEIAAAKLSRSEGELLYQHDAFLRSPKGRLKLRWVNGCGQLIYYERADEAGPKVSTFSIAPVADFDAMRETMAQGLGQLGEVKKRRKLFIVGQTRVHVDQVEGLGDFVELEVCMREGQTVSEGEQIAHELMGNLGISESDLITGAYTDLLAQQRTP